MDYKKTNAPATTVTRDMMELCADTGNVYETLGRKRSCWYNVFPDFGRRYCFLSFFPQEQAIQEIRRLGSYNDIIKGNVSMYSI